MTSIPSGPLVVPLPPPVAPVPPPVAAVETDLTALLARFGVTDLGEPADGLVSPGHESGPAAAEPAVAEPAVAGPAVAQPAATEPAPVGPAGGSPVREHVDPESWATAEAPGPGPDLGPDLLPATSVREPEAAPSGPPREAGPVGVEVVAVGTALGGDRVPVQALPVQALPVQAPPVQAPPVVTAPVVVVPVQAAAPFVPPGPPVLSPDLLLAAQARDEAGSRVHLEFRDGSTAHLEPGSEQARALADLARALTSAD